MQKIVVKNPRDHPGRSHRPYHAECKTYLRNVFYNLFKNNGHKQIKIGLYCPTCKYFYPTEKVKVGKIG